MATHRQRTGVCGGTTFFHVPVERVLHDCILAASGQASVFSTSRAVWRVWVLHLRIAKRDVPGVWESERLRKRRNARNRVPKPIEALGARHTSLRYLNRVRLSAHRVSRESNRRLTSPLHPAARRRERGEEKGESRRADPHFRRLRLADAQSPHHPIPHSPTHRFTVQPRRLNRIRIGSYSLPTLPRVSGAGGEVFCDCAR